MEIISSYLPSAGIGYDFSSIHLEPMTFLEMTQYVDGVKDISEIERYFYDIRMLAHEDPNILLTTQLHNDTLPHPYICCYHKAI